MHPLNRVAILPVVAALAFAPAPAIAAPSQAKTIPACTKAAGPAQAVLVEHNKHCAPATPPPPVPTCAPADPSPISATRQAGPYTVTKLAATSLAVAKPTGGLNAATELDINVGGTGYGFTKGASVPWFQLPWSDSEVRVENWQYFDGQAITSIQFYAYPYGPLFGGWTPLDAPIVMGQPPTDCIAS